MNYNKPTVGTRLLSMLLDHFFMTFIAVGTAFLLNIQSFTAAFNVSHEQAELFPAWSIYSFATAFALYFCKDSFNGRSIAKRITSLQVVNDKTGDPANPLRCLVRNVFCMLWPVEVFITLFSPTRRLGDYVACTRVARYEYLQPKTRPNYKQAVLAFLLAAAVLMLVASPLAYFLENTYTGNVQYIESSYNGEESKALTQAYTDEFGDYLVPDIRVYDKVKGSDLKYVSIILRLKENILSDDDDASDSLHEQVKRVLFSHYPEGTVQARVQYVYSGRGGFRSFTRLVN